jgi:hypothetical protein
MAEPITPRRTAPRAAIRVLRVIGYATLVFLTWLLALQASTAPAPYPVELSTFGPAGAALLSGQLESVYSNPIVQAGPFELLPHGLFFVFGDGGPVSLFTFYFLCLLGLHAAFALLASAISPRTAGWGALIPVAATAMFVLSGVSSWAVVDGHPAQVVVPMLWVCAAALAIRDRPIIAAALIALSTGWEVWGILGAPVLLIATNPRFVRSILVATTVGAVVYLPFVLTGSFAMFSFAWPISTGSLMHVLAPDLSTFPWGLRLIQAGLALGAGAFVALKLRRSLTVVWLAPLAILTTRLLFDPLLYGYYFIAPMCVVLIGASMEASASRRLSFIASAAFALWLLLPWSTSFLGCVATTVMVAATVIMQLYLTRTAREPREQTTRASAAGAVQQHFEE